MEPTVIAGLIREVFNCKGPEASVDGPGCKDASGTNTNPSASKDSAAGKSQFIQQGIQLFDQFMKDKKGDGMAQLPPPTRDDDDGLVTSLLGMIANQPKPSATRGDIPDKGRMIERLSRLAYRYAQSEERQEMKELANNIKFDLSSDDLGALLVSMMSSRKEPEECIVLVVFFCLDIGLRCVKTGVKPYVDVLNLCYKIMQLAITESSDSGPCDNDWEGTEV